MKAVRIHKFGDSEDVLQYEDVPVPEPKAGEVLIKIEAASLNRADLSLRKGAYRISPDQLPVIPGREFAGTVEKLGANVNEFKVGQRVVAYPSLGGYAEHAAAKTTEVRPLPDGVTFAHAAATPTVFLTAWFGLLTDGNLKSGEWLLAQGGSSGVGTAAIQIAKHFGAKVIATTGSEEKARRLRKLGADVTIDVSQNDFLSEGMRVTDNRGVDVVLEMIGGEVYQRVFKRLLPEAVSSRSAARSARFPTRRPTWRRDARRHVFPSPTISKPSRKTSSNSMRF